MSVKGAYSGMMYNRGGPELIEVNGIPCWRWGDKVVPMIAGGDGTGDSAGTGDGASGTAQGAAAAQGATTQPAAAGEDPAGKATDSETWDADRAKSTIAEIRASEKALKAKNAELAKVNAEALAKLKAIEDGEKSELDKANERAAQAEAERSEALARLQERQTRFAVVTEAAKLNVVDPEAAFLLLDRTKIETDEDGEPKNVDVLLKALVKDKPYLIKTSQATGVPETPRGDGTQPLSDAAAKEARERMERQYAQNY